MARNYARKKAAFTGVPDMQLITPSKWLADLVKQSYLREYPVEVVYNTIDKAIFKPTPSNFREKYGLTDKTIVLGVANLWEERKGLKDFYALAKMLDSSYAIVLVGLNEKQIRELTKNIPGLTLKESEQACLSVPSAGTGKDAAENRPHTNGYRGSTECTSRV